MPGQARSDHTRDVRTGGSWSLPQRAKNEAIWAAARYALALARVLPLGTLRTLGRWLGKTAHVLLPGTRRIARDNVRRVFPGLDEGARRALVTRCFSTLGEFLGETVALLEGRAKLPPLAIPPDSVSVLEQARSEGRGVVLASAHLGPWERVAASLVAAGVPLVALAREAYDPRFSSLYESLRNANGVRFIWRARPGATARILRTLRNGEVLGIPMDLRGRVPSLDAPFLGHPAPTAAGPARIALRARAAVVVGTVAPAQDGALFVTVTRVRSEDLAPDAEGAKTLTARINAELSRRILALPHAWVWMHERWPVAPEL
jgi:KDO2-lipid IV(A) lauroyltransferase